MRPHDDLRCLTSAEISGLSFVFPERFLQEVACNSQDLQPKTTGRPDPLLRSEITGAQALMDTALQLSRAIARLDLSSPILAAQLLDQLEQCLIATPTVRPSLGARRRWLIVRESIDWMKTHLSEPFRIGDVAAALQIPTRTIQQAFADELGRPPLAQAKLLRLHALRSRLQDPTKKKATIATQMNACGLPASGETALAYRACFGEKPSQTKRNLS